MPVSTPPPADITRRLLRNRSTCCNAITGYTKVSQTDKDLMTNMVDFALHWTLQKKKHTCGGGMTKAPLHGGCA